MAILSNSGTVVDFPLYIIFYTLAAGLKIGLLAPLIFKWHFPLSEVPGPKLAAWTRFWWIKTLYDRRIAEKMVRPDKEYGMSDLVVQFME